MKVSAQVHQQLRHPGGNIIRAGENTRTQAENPRVAPHQLLVLEQSHHQSPDAVHGFLVAHVGEKWRKKPSPSCLMTHLLQSTEDHGDLVSVEESLRHQRQTGLCVPLKFVVTVVILNRSDLEAGTETGRCHLDGLCSFILLSHVILLNHVVLDLLIALDERLQLQQDALSEVRDAGRGIAAACGGARGRATPAELDLPAAHRDD
ncbi:hypothetical protein EYF80_023060 [Liparis tanakae]|uniref:Uncharacterized protein n=1 Tax=Liparis tanakae TaxID=230148 RepID=A0A4Z2HMB0_9TELE|nr:hypothetical protein EYF80_023060 [Liparis tanakae]